MSSFEMCMIGGSGRSGTTILKKIFSKHPDVAYVPEWRFMIDPDGIIDFYNTFSSGWSPYLYDLKLKRLKKLLKAVGKANLINRMLDFGVRKIGLDKIVPFKLTLRYGELNVKKLCPDYFNFVKQLINQLVEISYRGEWTGRGFGQRNIFFYKEPQTEEELGDIFRTFFLEVSQSVLKKQKAQYYLDDNTWNILWFDKILKLLPEAKLVHIYRDPRDVVASYIKQRWMPSDAIKAAKVYKGLIENWWKVRNRLTADCFKEISLESLVSAPKEILEDLCDFWHISWHENLLITDLGRSHSGRWKKELTSSQKDQINSILREPLHEMGYK